jgi:hypothetical protein
MLLIRYHSRMQASMRWQEPQPANDDEVPTELQTNNTLRTEDAHGRPDKQASSGAGVR